MMSLGCPSLAIKRPQASAIDVPQLSLSSLSSSVALLKCYLPISITKPLQPIQTMSLPQTQGDTILDAWDYKGRPAERSRTGGWMSAAMILGPYTLLLLYLCSTPGPNFLFSVILSTSRFCLSLMCFCFLSGVEACERLTTLGIAVNLVTYLTGTMHLGNASSANTVTNFLGTSFMLCLLGGFVADTFLGRFELC